MNKDSVEKQGVTNTKDEKGGRDMAKLHTLANPEKVWETAKKNTKLNAKGQPLICKDDEDYNEEWEE